MPANKSLELNYIHILEKRMKSLNKYESVTECL